jgi:predicted RND superfamily exporter protein
VVAAVKQFRQDNGAWFEGENLRQSIASAADAAAGAGEDFSDHRINLRLATGNIGVAAAINDTVRAVEHRMLFFLYGAVFVMCLLSFRSILAAVCIILPLILVTELGHSLMVELDIGMKVNTLTVVALGVGIGVDYAIYIYSRMKEFLDQGESLHEAYYKALRLTGTAVLFTAVTLAVGVGTWIFSELKFQADMGILLSFMFVMNMVGALVLLPALLRLLTKAGWAKPKAA